MSTTALSSLRDYLLGTLSVNDMTWLMEELAGYIQKEQHPEPYTMDELNTRIDKSERDAAEGRVRPHEEVFASILNVERLSAI
ncbi:MAG: hypothetical protein IJV60_03825 [Prevotella sp.]|nr:hypothetical protein [Prevotella sp.]MBQ8058282.1 hypothetical protein [Prevotella sp.]